MWSYKGSCLNAHEETPGMSSHLWAVEDEVVPLLQELPILVASDSLASQVKPAQPDVEW